MLYSLTFFIVIPTSLIIIADVLIRKRSDQDTVGRRSLLFYIWTGMGLLTIAILCFWLIPPLGFGIPIMLAPVFSGVITILALHRHDWNLVSDKERKAILYAAGTLAALVLASFVIFRIVTDPRFREILFLGQAVITIPILLVVVWSVGKRHPILMGTLALLFMLVFNALEGGSLSFFDEMSGVWSLLVNMAVYLALLGLVIPSVIMLVSHPFDQLAGSGELARISWQIITIQFFLAILLLGLFSYTIMWLCVWDGIDDGIRGLFMIMLTILTAVAGGMVILTTSTGWRRWTGVATAILIVGLVRWAVTVPGNAYHPYDITQARAEQIQAAIEKYHAKTSWYPFDLSDLVPGEMWRIPLPMIIPGENWCYQGSSNYYRLGVIYRDHWSSPYLSIKVYASAGNVPDEPWVCDERLSILLSRYSLAGVIPADATPAPTSEVPVGRTVIEPILRATSIVVGTWSPDGKYLAFGQTRLTGEVEGPLEIDVQFLDAQTGKICSSAENKWRAGERSDGLYQHHVWLTDGRFLYVSDYGEMVILQPCVEGKEDLKDRYAVKFTQVESVEAGSRYAVLKSQDFFWLLDGTTLNVQQIPGVLPASTTDQRDWIAWSPNGDRLAIAQTTGQDASAGATIFIVNTLSGVMERQIPLTGNADTVDGPIVDWLSRDGLLVQYANSLLILDLRSDPVKVTDLVRDVLLLDLSYPSDFSSMDFIRHTDSNSYSIAIRANHPHNQNAYLYESQTGQVTVFQHDVSTLFFYPDGQWLQTLKWEDVPSYKDEYEMVWMDHPEDAYYLKVEGHVPRSYPQITPKYVSTTSQLLFNSSQGISLISLPDGKTVQFWQLAGSNGSSNRVLLSPNDDSLVVLVDGVGLYHIPLSSK